MKQRTPISPERLQELRQMPYKDYLKTDEWRRRRFLALSIAGEHCQVCNAPGPGLQVHHRRYDHIGEERPVRDLTVLCERCHELFSRYGRLVRPEQEVQS